MSKKMNTSSLYLIPLLLLYIATLIAALAIGRYRVDIFEIIKILLSKVFPIAQTWSLQAESAILSIRLPRIIGSTLVGSGLAVAGLVMQQVFHNPMVSPDVLGTSSAAGFGAALAMVLALPSAFISPLAFAFGLLSVALVYLVASRVPNNHILGLVLGGIMISSLFSSLLSFVKLMADPENTLPSITYFLMGSLSSVGSKDVKMAALPILASSLMLYLLSWRISLLSINDSESRSLGVNTKLLRTAVIVFTVVIVASSVAISGVIGWVGLVIPHITRMLMGCNTKKTIPASMLLGAIFLTISDTISRTIAFSEIPIGIITGIIGAPFFLYLIVREGRRTNG